MISVTHFADRDGQFLAAVSPRRYFCTGCHVPQHDVKAPIKNDFVDVDSLLTSTAPGARVDVRPGPVTVKILERVKSFRVMSRAGKKR
jgi:hypothetical protein